MQFKNSELRMYTVYVQKNFQTMANNQEQMEIQVKEFLEKIAKDDILEMNSSEKLESILFSENWGEILPLKVNEDITESNCMLSHSF